METQDIIYKNLSSQTALTTIHTVFQLVQNRYFVRAFFMLKKIF